MDEPYLGLGHFAVGFCAAFAVLWTLLRLRYLLTSALAGIALAIVVIVAGRGFDGLAALLWRVILEARGQGGLYEGLLAGKLVVALLRSSGARRP